jgi:hypothetical protein
MCVPVMADQLFNSIIMKKQGLSYTLIAGELSLVRQLLILLGSQKLLKKKHFNKA